MQTSMTVMFPLTFASNVYVDPATMPGWVQAFVNNNPITHLTTAARGLAHGTGGVVDEVAIVLLWSAALVLVFAPLTMRLYNSERSSPTRRRWSPPAGGNRRPRPGPGYLGSRPHRGPARRLQARSCWLTAHGPATWRRRPDARTTRTSPNLRALRDLVTATRGQAGNVAVFPKGLGVPNGA
jgi:hypothetical protein